MTRRAITVSTCLALAVAASTTLACSVAPDDDSDSPSRAAGPAGTSTSAPRGAHLMAKPGGPAPDSKFCTSSPTLKYYGGPVLQNVKVYNVNWGAGVNAMVTAQLPRFYSDLVASPYFDWLSEYNTAGLAGQDTQPGSNQGLSRGTFAGSVTIQPSMCPGTGSPNSCPLTDAQVRSELDAQIAAGTLPAPSKGCDGLNDTLYMLNFNSSVAVSLSPSLVTCVQLCGYHSTGVYQGNRYAYAVIPDYFTGFCSGVGGCGYNTALQNTTAIAAHEMAEAVTDPEVGFAATPTSRPAAWSDAVCGEIGDICEHLYGTIDTGGTTWTVQQLWSNEVNDCITTKASLPAVCTAAGTPPGCRPCTCADDNLGAPGVPGCGGGTPWCETDVTNIKHGLCVQCTDTAECTSPAACTKSTLPATDDTCAVPPCGATGTPCCAPDGACVAPNTCVAGLCGCVPRMACPSGVDCGNGPDGCGGTILCGTCSSPESCGGGGTAGVCGCTRATCATAGAECGAVEDNCGGTLSCGSCLAGETCTSLHHCATSDAGVAPAPDAAALTDAASIDGATQPPDATAEGGTTDAGESSDGAGPEAHPDASWDGGDAGGPHGAASNGSGCGCWVVCAGQDSLPPALMTAAALGLGLTRRRQRQGAAGHQVS